MNKFRRDATTIQSECGILIPAEANADRSMPAVLSTGIVARDNHKIDPKGWIFPASVPLLDSHDDAGIDNVLGKVNYIRVGKAQIASGESVTALLGTVTFAEAAVNPAAEIAYRLYAAGFVDSLSVSFIPLKYTPARDRGGRAMDISSAELLEVSTVSVPSDVNAKVLARAIRSQMSGRSTASDRAVIARAASVLGRTAAGRGAHVDSDTARRIAVADKLMKEFQETEERRRRAARLSSKLPKASREALEQVQAHHASCERHAGELQRAHTRMADDVDSLPGIHRALTRAISAAGVKGDYGIKKAMSDLERCSSSIATGHDGATTAAEDLGIALDAAKDGVQNVVDGIAELDEA